MKKCIMSALLLILFSGIATAQKASTKTSSNQKAAKKGVVQKKGSTTSKPVVKENTVEYPAKLPVYATAIDSAGIPPKKQE
jgi:hypothetical protein